MFIVLFSISYAEENESSTGTAIEQENKVNYPQQIIWNYEMFSRTNQVFQINTENLKKIGEYYGFDVYEEIGDTDSKFIKTNKGYLLYIKLDGIVKKPNIYLYPTKEQEILVKLQFDGKITTSYPKYNNGWRIIANEVGEIRNLSDNKPYSYLFWEGLYKKNWNLSQGYVVKGEETASFLQEKLAYMGLTPKEYNEFIVFWLPQMENNNYNFISFVNEEYAREIKLNVSPTPDTVIRVFMVFKNIDKEESVKESKLFPFKRTGFTVVEWGGMELK